MTTITLYLDMDGVVADFEKAFRKSNPTFVFNRELFQKCCLEERIFETLEWMPNGRAFMDEIYRLKDAYNLNVEMLTSTGSKRSDIKATVSEQKTIWLRNNGIPFKPNFVSSKPEKSEYATAHTILIDDHIGCTEPFIEKGGIAFLHRDYDYKATIQKLDWYLDELTKEFV